MDWYARYRHAHYCRKLLVGKDYLEQVYTTRDTLFTQFTPHRLTCLYGIIFTDFLANGPL